MTDLKILKLQDSETGEWVIEVTGEADLLTSGMLASALMGEGPARLDLTRVRFIDSVALAVIVIAHRRRQLVIVIAPETQPAVAMRLTGLDKVLKVEGN